MDSDAANTQQDWRTKLPDGSIFFPYSTCLAFRIIESGPHTSYDCKLDTADLDVTVRIEKVLRDVVDSHNFEKPKSSLKAGSNAIFCLSTKQKPQLKKLINSLNDKLQVWAFSSGFRASRNRVYFDVEDRFEPFSNQEISKDSVQILAADLTKRATPEDLKHSIEHYLRSRWTENRIRDFCRSENRLLNYMAYPYPSEFKNDSNSASALQGLLYSKPELGDIMWKASETRQIPTYYGLTVQHGKSLWQLERGPFHLGSTLSDDDVLKMRVHNTLESAFRKSFDAHTFIPDVKQQRQAIASKTPLGLVPDWSALSVERSGSQISLSCTTAPKGKLKIILNDKREIHSIMVDGKVNPEWENSLAAAKKDMSRTYD